MVEWKKMRSMTGTAWDQHLRELAAKTESAVNQPRFSNKKKKNERSEQVEIRICWTKY